MASMTSAVTRPQQFKRCNCGIARGLSMLKAAPFRSSLVTEPPVQSLSFWCCRCGSVGNGITGGGTLLSMLPSNHPSAYPAARTVRAKLAPLIAGIRDCQAVDRCIAALTANVVVALP